LLHVSVDLQAFKLGPIEWLSSQELFQGQCSSMNHVELKAKEAELLEVRRMQLRMVQVQAGTVLHSLAQYLKRLFSQRQGLPRGLAAQVLRADVVAQVLDLQVPCFPQVGCRGVCCRLAEPTSCHTSGALCDAHD
jgi:hypothetical protein